MPITPPRLLIIADDLLTRTGLATLIAERADVTIVGQIGVAASGAELAAYNPDAMLWDMGWSSAPAIARLAALDDLPAPVVALIQDKSLAIDAWTAGARGVFTRSAPIGQVIAGLLAVIGGIVAIDPALADTLVAARGLPLPAIEPPSDALTGREREVLQLVARGLANKAIARELNISESTVKFHINAILGKLGAQSRTDAVVRATRIGLVIL